MFSPQNRDRNKGKAVASPVKPRLHEPSDDDYAACDGDAVPESGDPWVWRQFRDAGLLDEAALARKDRDALARRVSELQNELQEYQHNMGLLLIEKNELASKNEEIAEALAEAEEILKREQSAHFIAISEYEEQVRNIKKSSLSEKQLTATLERTINELRGELTEVRSSFDKKLTEVQSFEASLQEKYLENEAKLHKANAIIAEASNKSSQADRKLEEFDALQRRFQREKLSFDAERRAYERFVEEEDTRLREWESQLQESQKLHFEKQQALSDHKDRLNERELVLKQEQADLDIKMRSIQSASSSLRIEEENILISKQALDKIEKSLNSRLASLEEKEKDTVAREIAITTREKAEIQMLYDDHSAVLESEQKKFEMKLQVERENFENIRAELGSAKKMKIENDYREKEISEREQSVEGRIWELQDIEKGLDVKSKALKNWEESLSNNQKRLKCERELLDGTIQHMENLKADLESLSTKIQCRDDQMLSEESLRLAEADKEQYLLLKSQLQREKDTYTMLNSLAFKALENLQVQCCDVDEANRDETLVRADLEDVSKTEKRVFDRFISHMPSLRKCLRIFTSNKDEESSECATEFSGADSTECSIPDNSDSPTKVSKQKDPNRRKNRTVTMKRTVLGVKAIPSRATDTDNQEHLNGDAVDDSVHNNQSGEISGKKRHLDHLHEMTNNGGHFESTSPHGNRKRRHTVFLTPTPGEMRYNLRSRTATPKGAAKGQTGNHSKPVKKSCHQAAPVNGAAKDDAVQTSHVAEPSGDSDRNVMSEVPVQSLVNKVDEQYEISLQNPAEMDAGLGPSTLEINDVITELDFGAHTIMDEIMDDTEAHPMHLTALHSAYDSEDPSEDEDEANTHDHSIPKKIWNFFTT